MCRTDRAPQLSRRWASVEEARAKRHIASGRRGLGSVPHPSREVPAASQGRCISRPSAPLAAAAARAFFCARWSMASQMIVSPEWSKAVKSATLEAASLSTREPPGAPRGGTGAEVGHCQGAALTMLCRSTDRRGRRAAPAR
eukprot:scaffold96066_cov68-Phaeocystis_antarctica.AAC.3